MKATEFLHKAASLLEERGKQYDQPKGERSMGKAVTAFNAITSRDLSEAEGWLLLQLLKDVRQWQNPERYHADSAEDCVSYAALKAEALASKCPFFGEISEPFAALDPSPPFPFPPAVDAMIHNEIDDESPRAQVIGQNGEMASEVYAAIDGKPSWINAPAWATHLMERQGSYEWALFCRGEYFDDYDPEDSCEFIVSEDEWTVIEARPCQ